MPAASASGRPTSQVPASRRYLPGTNVLETSWETQHRLDHRARRAADGARGTTRRSGPRTQRRAPTDYDAEHFLLRTVRCVNGSVQLIMDCEPVFDYGRTFGALGVRRAPATTRASLVREAPTSS